MLVLEVLFQLPLSAKVFFAGLAIIVAGALGPVLLESDLGGKVLIAIPARPVAQGVAPVLVESTLKDERTVAAFAVCHLGRCG
jgi:hypothetical protein